MEHSDEVVDHFEQPRNIGALDKDDPDVGTGTVGAVECGDVMRLQLKVNERTGIIEDAKFKTFGCGSAIASSSLATEWIKGRTLDEALEIDKTEILTELSLPPAKIHCTMMAEDAIRAAIADYKAKRAARQGAAAPQSSAGVAVGEPPAGAAMFGLAPATQVGAAGGAAPPESQPASGAAPEGQSAATDADSKSELALSEALPAAELGGRATGPARSKVPTREGA
jgi:nitrogen fixation NifU-like protein